MSMYQLFLFTVFALIAIITICLVKAHEKMKNNWYGFETRVPTERDREIQADMKRTRLRIMDTLSILNTYQDLPVTEQIENDDYLDKFNASKAKRKQSPSSPATPVVKSKRSRK